MNDSKTENIKLQLKREVNLKLLALKNNKKNENGPKAHLGEMRVNALEFEEVLYTAISNYLNNIELEMFERLAIRDYVLAKDVDLESLYSEENAPKLAEYHANQNKEVVSKICLDDRFNKVVKCIYTEYELAKKLTNHKVKTLSKIPVDFI